MDGLNISSEPRISLNPPKNETASEGRTRPNVKQVSRNSHESPTRSTSCTGIPMNYLQSSSCTDIDGKSLFFNEKGWPVKVMRLTEDSPPKAIKPWPTRSLPVTSCKKTPCKEKTNYTQKQSAVVRKSIRNRAETLKLEKENKKSEPVEENKENKKSDPVIDVMIEKNSKTTDEQSNLKSKEAEENNGVEWSANGVDSDLKYMLHNLDQTMDKLTSGNKASQIKVSTNSSNKIKKIVDKSQIKSALERKTPHDVKKDDLIQSARSNKYNSKEVKAYMQAKRAERKIQMSEETRKRQDMLAIQKKNLEKLREKALQVLKKSSSKAVDENKPKWQGPLEADSSEVLPPAIHIFETKIPTARKSKTCVKSDDALTAANNEKESFSDKLSSKDLQSEYKKEEEIEQSNNISKKENMDSRKTNNCLEKSRNRLRLSKSKPSIESSPVKIGMEAAAMEIIPKLQLEMNSARRSFESQFQPSKASGDWDIHDSKFERSEIPNTPNNSRRTTFVCSPRESDRFVEVPPISEPYPNIIDHMDTSSTSRYRKRHQVSPTKSNNMTPKKLCVNSSEEVLNSKVLNSIEDQSRKIHQEILQKQKEEGKPDKLFSNIKPDGFSILNVMKMKLLANENQYVAKTNVKENRSQKMIITKHSCDDDTDAPSIISEEDFRAQPEPLRLSDLQLKLDTSGQTSFASQLSPVTSKTSRSSKRNEMDSLKSSSISSYTLDAPPLVIPESVQKLKLSTNRSFNELLSHSNKSTMSNSDVTGLKVSSCSGTLKSLQDKPPSLSLSKSSSIKTTHSHNKKQNFQEEYCRSNLLSEDPRKDIETIQGLVDDAQFQRKQVELMFKTQEDILLVQYKAEMSEVDMRYRSSNGHLTNLGEETKRIVEEKYRIPLKKLREKRDQALANSDARIEYLSKQISWLAKQKKGKTYKPRSAEASPKKLTPLRSISLTSVIEHSSSSESSVGLKTFDDKKRQETERDKASMSSRRKLEREVLRKLQEELTRVQELQKVDRCLKSSRSRRDKSTSPLESVPETSTKDAACSVNEDGENSSPHATSSSLRTVEEARSTDVYNSESFESIESSETPRHPKMIAKIPLSTRPLVAARPSYKSKVLIKMPLSPRVQVRSKRRGSSGSDESLPLSQNETQSEQSDYEVRITALKEQKRQRFAELNRLERELKRAQREQLKATESSLIKQIQAYELKIAQTKKQLEEVTLTNFVRPQIKHPRVSDKFFPRTSDAFQKAQTNEEPSKPPEQNSSDLDTQSLKSISEASSTETTIQSSGKIPAIKNSVEICNDFKDDVSVGSELTEAMSSLATEEPTVFDNQKSIESEVVNLSEPVIESVVSEIANQSNDINWMDAEKFFNEMDSNEKSLSIVSKFSKSSPEKYVSSGSPETNISVEISDEHKEISKESSSSQEFLDAAYVTATPKTDLSSNSTEKLESESNENTPEEEPFLKVESPEKDDLSDHVNEYVDEEGVMSIVYQSPLNKSQQSVSENQNSNAELNSTSHNSLSLLKPESDTSQRDDYNENDSIVMSEKNYVSEVPSQSVSGSGGTDSNTTSQCYSVEEGNDSHVDVDDNCNSSQSDVIKVFVSNKAQEFKEQTNADNNNLNKTYILIDAETKSDKDELVVDNITDKILQNLLSECLACKKHDTSARISENITECGESDDRTAATDAESKTLSFVNDFAQTVLNNLLKDATDCMLEMKHARRVAQMKSFNKDNEVLNRDISSNKLLEALALERKTIFTEKGREENTPSPKSTKSSNNEVELSEGNESEVFWFDEDLAPVSLQTQREAEELRLKQLQVEQEIEQIKKLAEAQETIPYFYLREIPNKPPPPYTPPGQSVQVKDLRPVPTQQEDIEEIVTTAMQGLLAVWRRGDDLSAAEPVEEYRLLKIGNQVYNKFLFDLVKQIFIDVTSNERDEKNLPPWERIGRTKCLVLPKLTEEFISDYAMKKVRVLFGFEPDLIKENLITQWSRKKRERMDEVILRESQEEEKDWTDYSEFEVAVKNNVALSIFDELLEETGHALNSALLKKLAYCQHST